VFFDDNVNASPPLPPAPLEEPAPIDYGTMHTKVFARSSKGEKQADFSPSLPSRPDQSIHPAGRHARGVSASSTPRMELSPPAKGQPLPVDINSPIEDMEPPTPPPDSEKPSIPSRPSSRPPSSAGSEPRKSITISNTDVGHSETLSPVSRSVKRRSAERSSLS